MSFLCIGTFCLERIQKKTEDITPFNLCPTESIKSDHDRVFMQTVAEVSRVVKRKCPHALRELVIWLTSPLIKEIKNLVLVQSPVTLDASIMRFWPVCCVPCVGARLSTTMGFTNTHNRPFIVSSGESLSPSLRWLRHSFLKPQMFLQASLSNEVINRSLVCVKISAHYLGASF